MARLQLCVAVVALLLAACTDGGSVEPTEAPSTAAPLPTAVEEPSGLRIGIVLPLETVRPLGPSAVRAAVGDLRVTTRDDVREYRVLQPDGPAFVGDLVALLADEGYDLVCAVGPGSAGAILPVAEDHPEVRFCATPAAAAEDVPENVHLISVRFDQAAYAAGAAAGQVLSPPPALDEESPSALRPGIVGDPAVIPAEAQTAAFRAGLARTTTRDIDVAVGVPDVEDRSTAEQTRFILEGGGEVVFGSAGSSLAGLVEGARTGNGFVVALVDPRAPLQEPAAELLATVGVDLAVAIELAVRAVLEGAAPEAASIGASEGAIVIAPGGAARAPQAVAAAQTAIEDLRAGRVTLP